MRLLNILPWYFSRWNGWSNNIKNLVKIHWRILSYLFHFSWFLLVSNVLTVINTFDALSLISMMAESIREHSVRHSHHTALWFPDHRWHYQSLCRIHCLPPSHVCCQLESPSPHSNQANYWCPKCFQVHYLHPLPLDGGQFFWFRIHSILDFVLHGGPLQTKLEAQVIFPTT